MPGTYSAFAASTGYTSAQAGALQAIMLIDEGDPSRTLVGFTTQSSFNVTFEQIEIEEAGNELPEEIVPGRSQCSGSLATHFTAKRADLLPSQQDFLGRKFTILRFFTNSADDLEAAVRGIVQEAVTGARIQSRASSSGARGAVTLNLSFAAKRHYTGEQWAVKAGTA